MQPVAPIPASNWNWLFPSLSFTSMLGMVASIPFLAEAKAQDLGIEIMVGSTYVYAAASVGALLHTAVKVVRVSQEGFRDRWNIAETFQQSIAYKNLYHREGILINTLTAPLAPVIMSLVLVAPFCFEIYKGVKGALCDNV